MAVGGQVNKIVNYTWRFTGAGQAQSAMQTVSRVAATAAAAIAGVGIALYRLSDRITQAPAHIEDLSRAIGIAAEDLAAFGYIAEQDGGSIDSFANGIRRMSRVIDDANDGLITYVRSFDAIGVTVDELLGKSPDEQFMIIAQAISQMDDASQKLAISQEIFGRGALDLIPTIDRGAEGIQAMAQEARDLGIVLDEDVYEASKRFQDGLVEIRSRFQATLIEGIEPLLPKILEMADKFSEMAVEIIPQLISALENALPVIETVVRGIGKALEGWGLILEDLNRGGLFGEVQRQLDYEGMETVYNEFGKYIEMSQMAQGATMETVEVVDQLSSALGEGGSSGGGGRSPGLTKTLRDLKFQMENTKFEKIMPSGKDMLEATKALEEGFSKQQQIVIDTGRRQIEQAQITRDILVSGADDFARALKGGGEEMLRLAIQIALELASASLGKSALGGGLFGFIGGLL